MAVYGEMDPSNCSTNLSGGFIITDRDSDRAFFVPSQIVAGDENGKPLDGIFNMDPETGSAIEQSSQIVDTVLGYRTVVAANVAINGSTIGDNVMIRDRVKISGSRVRDNVVIGRKCSISGNCNIGVGAVIGARCGLGRGTTVDNEVRVAPRQNIPPRATITLDTIQELPDGRNITSANIRLGRN